MKAKPDIRRYSLDDLRHLPDRTRADAPIRPVPQGFWKRARVVFPSGPSKTPVNLRIDSDVLAWFKAQGPGHLSRMNAVLRSYYEAEKSA